MSIIVDRFDRDIVQVYREALTAGDAAAILDAAADYVYRTEPADWISIWRRINRARFYVSAMRFPSVKPLTVAK